MRIKDYGIIPLEWLENEIKECERQKERMYTFDLGMSAAEYRGKLEILYTIKREILMSMMPLCEKVSNCYRMSKHI